MKTLEFQALDFGQSDWRVVEAAELLLNEVVHKDDGQSVRRGELRSFISNLDERDHRLYGMFEASGAAVAAADVRHGDAGSLSVWHIAVCEARRDEGLGTTFMQHLARVALETGDQSVWVPTSRSDFFEKLGFTKSGENSMSMPAVALA